MTKKKIKLEDLSPESFTAAQQIVGDVVSWLTLPSMPRYIYPLISKIKSLSKSKMHDGLHAGLHDGLYAGLRDGLHAGLHDGLYAGLRDGLYDGLDDGLDAGLYAGLDDGLHDGLRDGLDDGLHDGLYDGLHAGLHAGLHDGLRDGLYDGLDDGLDAGLYAGLDDGLHAGLHDGLDDGLHDGLYAGLHDGLRDGLDDGLHDGLHAGLRDGLHAGLRDGLHDGRGKMIYCGIFWAWWLIRYLIAARWGCQLDRAKLSLLFGWVRLAPIVMEVDKKILVAKPTKIKWRVSGKTRAPFEFPIYELHSEAESTVECAGIKLFFHKNIRIPKHMGMAKIADWKPEWILTEGNQEIKRLLLENISSEKISEVLDLRVIDTYQSPVSKYELVEAGQNPYPSRYRALKMACPSTGKPYLIRVHPDTRSARNAVVEFNGGVDPETFVLEH